MGVHHYQIGSDLVPGDDVAVGHPGQHPDLAAALQGPGSLIGHTGPQQIIGELESVLILDAEETLGLAEKYMGELGRGIDALSKIKLTDKKVMEFMAEFFPVTLDMPDVQRKNNLRLLEDMKRRYWEAPDLSHVGKNGYRFVNAISDFATHADPIRKTKLAHVLLSQPQGLLGLVDTEHDVLGVLSGPNALCGIQSQVKCVGTHNPNRRHGNLDTRAAIVGVHHYQIGSDPWHGLGTEVQEAPMSIDALVLAGLDWEVIQKNVYTQDGSLIPGYKVNLRSTDNAALGIVSDRYKVVQNEDAFQFTALMAFAIASKAVSTTSTTSRVLR